MSANGVRKVIKYLKDHRVSVRQGRENAYFPEEREIVYNASGNYKLQLYILLHEAGHYLQSKSKTFVVQNLENQKDSLHTNYQRFIILEQEIDAWKRGQNLAKRLSIRLDVEDYRKVSSGFIMLYVNDLSR